MSHLRWSVGRWLRGVRPAVCTVGLAAGLRLAGLLIAGLPIVSFPAGSIDLQAAEPPAATPQEAERVETLAEAGGAKSGQGQDEKTGWPLVLAEDFERGAERWEPVDPEGWRVEASDDGNHFYHQHAKASSYQPEHRSPLHQAYVKDLQLGSFVLEARVRSTHEDYGHRDACLFFGRENPSRLYYVHFGKQTDDHANQIFIVHDAPRTKISTQTTPGTPWDDAWHRVRVERDVKSGAIDVYFDDLTRPAMRAVDKTLVRGAIGLGSFDDTAAWDDVRIYAPATP